MPDKQKTFFGSFIKSLRGILTTKGDILTFGTTETRLLVGNDDESLLADSAQAIGIKWGDVPLSSGVTGTLPVANGGTGTTTSTGTLNTVLSNSPVLQIPFIGGLQWTNANHLHTEDQRGGQLSQDALEDIAHVVKSVDETVTSSTTLQDDDELLFPVKANKNYAGWVKGFIVSDPDPDFKFAFSIPSGTTNKRSNAALSTVSAGAAADIDAVGTLITGNSNEKSFVVYFYVLVGATAGNVVFQWAQNTSDAANTTVKAGSSLMVVEQ